MTDSRDTVTRRRLLSVPLVTTLAILATSVSHAALAQSAGTIRISAAIPAAPAAMRRFTLSAAPVPVDVLNERLRALKLPPLVDEKGALVSRLIIRGRATDPDLLRAIITPSGEAHIVPNMLELVNATSPRSQAPTADRVQLAAGKLLGDTRLLARDGTVFRLGRPTVVTGAGVQRQFDAFGRPLKDVLVAARPVMTIVAAQRFADGFAVYGRGSRVAVTIGNDGAVVGLMRRWQTAKLADRIAPTVDADAVKRSIQRQLTPAVTGKGSVAIVDTIQLGYYDGNAKWLQPVYRFEATVYSGDQRTTIRTAGYVPFGALAEPIPDLTDKQDARPPAAPKPPRAIAGGAPFASFAPQAAVTAASLGEYINREWRTDGGYTAMANAFLNGLTFARAPFIGSPSARPVTRTQYYEAWPWEVSGWNNLSFLNAVNIAYTVPHGDWLLNTTLGNYGDAWYVTDIGANGTPGFGAAAGGKLATWIIASCEVIPSFYDRAHEVNTNGNGYRAFDAWWPVFKGLHAAIGYRTIMYYPNTDLNFGFGFAAGQGGDQVAQWFQQIAAHGSTGTYANGHLTGVGQVALRSRIGDGGRAQSRPVAAQHQPADGGRAAVELLDERLRRFSPPFAARRGDVKGGEARVRPTRLAPTSGPAKLPASAAVHRDGDTERRPVTDQSFKMPRFFLTPPAPCPYLPGRMERKIFAELRGPDATATHERLTAIGFRRSQNVVYRPHCGACRACVSVRVPAARFEPSASQKRQVRRHADLEVSACEPWSTEEQYSLLRRYLAARHEAGGMTRMDAFDFADMVEGSPLDTLVIEYREPSIDGRLGALVAACLTDRQVDGLSMVYSFYDPDSPRRGLGTTVILDHITRAAAVGLDYVYLGYWVPGARRMAYKANFRPLEALTKDGWKPLS